MILRPIVEQHVDNAAFLWCLRTKAAQSSHYFLRHLERLDDRLEAHLDGLRIAGDEGWEISKAMLEDGQAGELFTAALLAIENDDLKRIAFVLDESGEKPERLHGVASAIEWAPDDRVRWILPGLLHPSCPPPLWWLGIAACVAHGVDPGTAIERAAQSEDLRLRCIALEAAAKLGRKDLRYLIDPNLGAELDDLRFSAAWAAALLGNSRAVSVLRDLAHAGGPHAEEALIMAVRCAGPREASAWIEMLATRPEAARSVTLGIAALGNPAHVPWLIDAMANPKLARIAGEAYAQITGVVLDEHKLDRPPPPDFQAGPNDDPNDEDVAPDPDEELKWPDENAVRAHWKKTGAKLEAGRRYFLGKPIATPVLDEALRSATQRLRAAAAIELTLLTPGRPLYNVTAPAFRQH